MLDMFNIYSVMKWKWKFGISASYQQAIVLEGSYWKRRIEVVIKEYHKWRNYYKKRVSIHFCTEDIIFQIFGATLAAR